MINNPTPYLRKGMTGCSTVLPQGLDQVLNVQYSTVLVQGPGSMARLACGVPRLYPVVRSMYCTYGRYVVAPGTMARRVLYHVVVLCLLVVRSSVIPVLSSE